MNQLRADDNRVALSSPNYEGFRVPPKSVGSSTERSIPGKSAETEANEIQRTDLVSPKERQNSSTLSKTVF